MKNKEKYLSEYESILKQTDFARQRFNDLNNKKQELQNQSNSAEQILSIDNQVKALTIQLEQLNGQSLVQKNELNGLIYNDDILKQKISDLEKQYHDTKESVNKYDQAFTEMMIIFNGFSAKEGFKLNQAEVLTKILPPEELIHTDILKKACEMNHREEFDKVMGKITEINFQDKEGKTILMHAISNGFYYGVDKLLARGADVNLLDNNGANALIYCAKIPHIKYLKLIAEQTTDLNHQAAGFDGMNALHFLIPNGNKIMFASELNGELKDTNDDHSNLCLDESFTLTKNTNIIQTKGSHVLTIGASGIAITLGSPINHPTSYEKTLTLIEFLVNRGMNINAQNDHGQSPFFLACLHKLKHLANKMLDNFAIDYNISDKNDSTALHYTAYTGDELCAANIIAKNVLDINAKNKGGGIPALWAAQLNNKAMLELLYEKGADINIPATMDGFYPWHYAAFFGAIDAIKFLTDKIADIDLKTNDKDKYTALWLSAQEGKLDVVQYLISKDANVDLSRESDGRTVLQAAIFGKKLSVVQELVTHKADINKPDIDNSTPLLLAAQVNDISIMKYLIDNGADVNKVGFADQVPLHWSAYHANLTAMKMLIDKGADISMVGDMQYGNTMLHEVLWEDSKARSEDKIKAVQYLLLHKAVANIPNAKGDTAHDLAERHFKEALPWLEHPENLPSLEQFELGLIGDFSYATI